MTAVIAILMVLAIAWCVGCRVAERQRREDYPKPMATRCQQ